MSRSATTARTGTSRTTASDEPAEKLLGAYERRGFVVLHEHGSLQVVPSDMLTSDDPAAIDRARSKGFVIKREGKSDIETQRVKWGEETNYGADQAQGD